MKKFRMNRRSVLRGMLGGSAVAVGMPLLEAMLNANGDAHADGSGLDCNFMTWFWGNGVYLPTFEPTTTGTDWDLSESLQPLAPVNGILALLPYPHIARSGADATGFRERIRHRVAGAELGQRPDVGDLQHGIGDCFCNDETSVLAERLWQVVLLVVAGSVAGSGRHQAWR